MRMNGGIVALFSASCAAWPGSPPVDRPPQIEEVYKAGAEQCKAGPPAECLLIIRGTPLAPTAARQRCDALQMTCEFNTCVREREFDGRTVRDVCHFDEAYGATFAVRMARTGDEDTVLAARVLVRAYDALLVELQRPPTLSVLDTPPDDELPGVGGRVQVRGYTRQDGTYVRPHSRRR